MLTAKSKRRKIELALLVALTGAVFGQGGIGCAELFADAAAAGVDFCFLLNCQEGFFNGLVQPCDPEAGFTFFIDCPELTPPFGTGLGTSGEDDGNNLGGFRPPANGE